MTTIHDATDQAPRSWPRLTRPPSPVTTGTSRFRCYGTGRRARSSATISPISPSTSAPARSLGRYRRGSVSGCPAGGDRRPERTRVPGRQQRHLSGGRRHLASGLRAPPAATDRDPRRTGRQARHAEIPVRREHHRGRRAALADPGPVRSRIQPAGQDQRAAADHYPNLWGYARDLYQRPAFRDTTDFAAFGMFAAGPRPSFFNDASWRIHVEPVHADWDSPHRREALS